MTPASHSSWAAFEGIPKYCVTAMPGEPAAPLASVLAISLAPVKSSAMTPSSIGSLFGPVEDGRDVNTSSRAEKGGRRQAALRDAYDVERRIRRVTATCHAR